MKRKWILLLLALMLAMTALSAAGETLTAEEGAKIEFAFWESSDAIHETWEEILADFRAAHPEIELVATTYPSSGFVAQIDTRFAAKDYPDVVMCAYQNIGKYKQSKLLLDITPYLSAEEKANYLPGYLTAFSEGEALYGLPLHTDTICIVYNKRMFEEQSIRIPTSLDDAWTLEEMNEIAAKLKAAYSLDYAFGGIFTKKGGQRFLPFLYMLGGHVFDPEDMNKLDIDTDEFRAALNIYKNWLDEGLIFNYPMTASGSPANDMLSAEQLAFSMSGCWQVDNIEKGLPGGWAITYLPSVNGNMTCDLGGNGLFAMGTTQYPQATAILIEYLTSRDVMTKFCQGGSFIPVRNDIDRSALVYAKYNEEMQKIVEYVSTLSPLLVKEQTSANASLFKTIFSEEMDAMIVDGEDADAVIEHILARWEEEMD